MHILCECNFNWFQTDGSGTHLNSVSQTCTLREFIFNCFWGSQIGAESKLIFTYAYITRINFQLIFKLSDPGQTRLNFQVRMCTWRELLSINFQTHRSDGLFCATGSLYMPSFLSTHIVQKSQLCEICTFNQMILFFEFSSRFEARLPRLGIC